MGRGSSRSLCCPTDVTEFARSCGYTVPSHSRRPQWVQQWPTVPGSSTSDLDRDSAGSARPNAAGPGRCGPPDTPGRQSGPQSQVVWDKCSARTAASAGGADLVPLAQGHATSTDVIPWRVGAIAAISGSADHSYDPLMARKGALSTLVFGLLMSAIAVLPARPAVAADNPVVVENQQAGTSAWQLSQTADDVNKQIKGYADTTSVLQGGSVNLFVTVNPAQTFSVDVYRIGWYGGLGGRLRLHAGPITGATQPACPADATTGMIECGWAASYTVAVGADWTSGAYLTLLTNAAGYKNYVPFVVRDGRPAQFLYQSAVATGQAYNNYPNDGATGKSLYEFNSFGPNTVTGTTRAAKVSFNRPYSDYGEGGFLSWELQLVRWLEKLGYQVELQLAAQVA